MSQSLDPTRTFDEIPRPDSLADGPAAAHRDVAAPARLELLEEIARGGMGAILRGRDVDFGRDVAVKVLLEDHRGRPELAQRFLEEARIAGRLQHPGVVPVYALGRMPDGRPYFTMKLIKGRTLTALLAERKDPSSDRPRFLAVFEQVCQTIAYAHAHGVIHRDLKPANVMVGAFGEVQVMDWGLAKVLPRDGAADGERRDKPTEEVSMIRTPRGEGSDTAQDGSETRAGSVLGTPAYIAPEQARGEIEKVDERADVFGLGAVLCAVLTGRPPFVGPSESALKRAIQGDVAEAFARLDGCGADAELIALAKRCLAPEPAERPRHAGETAAAVTAYRESVERRLRQAEVANAEAKAKAEEGRKRRRLTLALAGSVLLTVLAMGGGAGSGGSAGAGGGAATRDRGGIESRGKRGAATGRLGPGARRPRQ
jgi:serine/threonine protein kinase